MTDNYFKNCPPVMSDGRHFTDWKSATRRNEYIKYINDTVRDDDYRMMLQCNGVKFMDKEWEYYSKKMNCWNNTCIHNYPTRTLPQFFPQELKAFNDSMDPSKPKLKNSCPQFKDYRLNTNHRGLACSDEKSRKTETKSFQPYELISNLHKDRLHGEERAKRSKTVPVGVEETPLYANIASEELMVPSISSQVSSLNASAPSGDVSTIYDPLVNNNRSLSHMHQQESESEEEFDSSEESEEDSEEDSSEESDSASEEY